MTSSVNEEVYTGRYVIDHIKEISLEDQDMSDFDDIKDREFVKREIDIDELLDYILHNDSDLLDYCNWYEEQGPRYIFDEVEGYYVNEEGRQVNVQDEDLYNPIVVVDGILRDGRSRLAKHIHEKRDSIEVYIAL